MSLPLYHIQLMANIGHHNMAVNPMTCALAYSPAGQVPLTQVVPEVPVGPGNPHPPTEWNTHKGRYNRWLGENSYYLVFQNN